MRLTLLILAAVLGLAFASPAQTATGTTYTFIPTGPWWGPVPGAGSLIATNANTNTFAAITNVVTLTAYTNVPTQTTFLTTNNGIVFTNIGMTNVTFTNTSIALNPAYITLSGAKTLNVWCSGACTNASGTATLKICYSLSPDGINWTARDGAHLLSWTANGLSVTNFYTNLDCSEAAFAKILSVENSDATYSYNLTNNYVLRP